MSTSVPIEVKDIRTYFFTEAGIVKAVDGVSMTIPSGKTLALVGESGCGKSVTALSIMRLLPPAGKIMGGEILFDGRNILKMSKREVMKIRGNEIAMVFQSPMTSLNPVFTIGDQIMETIVLHQKLSKREAEDLALEMLIKVNIPDPQIRSREYPHQMSGGMRQRVMIAMALVCSPKFLIADEPTTALDVTTQAQILDLMRGLQEEFGTSVLFISHDLGVVAETAHCVAVMYASKIVEYADVRELYRNPKHPYTVGLFESRPRLGIPKGARLYTIPGSVPNPLDAPSGCKFHPRCPYVQEECKRSEPELHEVSEGCRVACFKYGG